ncbi:MAG: hypothetical protein WAU91_04940 [Desulfatitalea sp.]
MAADPLAAEPKQSPVAPLEPGTHTLYQTISEHAKGTVTLAAGVRYDQLEWSIAGNSAGTRPNVLSELEWSDIRSHQLTLSANARLGRHFYGRGHVNYAWIRDGSVRDSDYGGDDHTQEWSRSISDTEEDQLWDVVAGGGYPFTFQQSRLLVAPLLGASIHKQNFRITNGQQVVSETPPPGYGSPPDVGPLDSRLNSTYSARWISLWTGIDLRYQLAAPPNGAPFMEWGLSLAYHFWSDYSAEADWNLREDLSHPVSFEHEADASGIVVQAEWLIRLNRYLDLNLNWNYCQWETDAGKDTVFLANGSEQTTMLNEVSWESQSVMLGLALRFY